MYVVSIICIQAMIKMYINRYAVLIQRNIIQGLKWMIIISFTKKYKSQTHTIKQIKQV